MVPSKCHLQAEVGGERAPQGKAGARELLGDNLAFLATLLLPARAHPTGICSSLGTASSCVRGQLAPVGPRGAGGMQEGEGRDGEAGASPGQVFFSRAIFARPRADLDFKSWPANAGCCSLLHHYGKINFPLSLEVEVITGFKV